ncbi:hypothetical protein [Paenibacillus pabuli]|uniref:hypothetical protein n=1 Tax=Paenibacillus pabuli TaxID=1472 RepID=UPI003CF92777
MLEKWLKVAADANFEKMIELAEDHSDGIYKELMIHLKIIKEKYSDLADETSAIEDLFIKKTRCDVTFIYNKTLSDGIELGKRMR